ncbi:hypothetical protein FRX31_001972 [Thalictrum thalictroides]|uniref:MRN complex-interacting protein N-terminal domain-containing protein n=1 Tax=Thalictrum thalictroides TaxID=46969 RepID=A0A7J6XF82_THATH|nr:hypothetical protein FRX31_001972 [Thalictrum thalictroides]
MVMEFGFQVKQQKKLSNKWNCVICNEKQSVRKVFARGFQAKDVRKFVQSFNMARQVADETLISPSEEFIDESVQINESCIEYNNEENKKRSNWSEYLDTEEQLEEGRGELEEEGKGCDYEPQIVTELPKELFKKPRLKNYSAGMNKTDGKKLYSPTFEKRKTNNKPCNSQAKRSSAGLIKPAEKRLYSPTFAKRKPYNEPSNTQEHKGGMKYQPAMAQGGEGASRWSDYLAQDDDYLSFGTAGDLSTQGPWNHDMLETSFNDQPVEDEVHPDFHL